MTWTVIDATRWAPAASDTRGLREKRWLVDDGGRRWLLKLPRESRPFEIAIEVLVLRLARAVGLAAAEPMPCSITEDGVSRRGILVASFVRDGEELSLGAEVLRGEDPTYNPEKNKHDHTIERVYAALVATEQRIGTPLVEPFAHMLAFDAWIGNGDRHPANWGVLVGRSGAMRLAPMFDPAACLGAELGNAKALLDGSKRSRERVARYAERCHSGFGDGGRLIRMSEVTARLRRWPVWGVRAPAWVEAFRAVDPAPLFAEAPEDWLPAARRELAIDLLGVRLRGLP